MPAIGVASDSQAQALPHSPELVELTALVDRVQRRWENAVSATRNNGGLGELERWNARVLCFLHSRRSPGSLGTISHLLS